jgi:uncharacterized protein with GYD domain
MIHQNRLLYWTAMWKWLYLSLYYMPSKMPTYIILMNWTDQGIRAAKDTIKRVENVKNAVERSGGKMVDAYYTIGQYDLVVTVQLPNDESAMSILLATGVLGNVRTTTLKAFSLSEEEKIISKLS